MFSPRQRQKRPLGFFNPESKLELQVQKALFRTNAEIIRDMCEKNIRQKQRELHREPPIPPIPYTNISPEVRWLLTRSARMQRVNNAGFSKFRNPVDNRVGSANGRRRSKIISLERERSMCSRVSSAREPDVKKCQCDVLGPQFCTDCTKVSKKDKLIKEQDKNFPRIEVHTRSLVAPDKVEKLYLSNPKELFYQQKKYKCGCTYDAALEITTPLVYTPHEVFQRLRHKKYLEQTARTIGQESQKELEYSKAKVNDSAVDQPLLEQRPSFIDEKTLPPMDLKVSVVFKNDIK